MGQIANQMVIDLFYEVKRKRKVKKAKKEQLQKADNEKESSSLRSAGGSAQSNDP